MKKHIFILVGLGILTCQNVSSQFVSQETAQRVAENFFASLRQSNSHRTMIIHTFGRNDQPTMYAFSTPNGWVLVAGDRRFEPILAYSDGNNSFPADEEMPPVMLYMLEWYSAQINSLRNNDVHREYQPQWNVYMDDSLNIPSRNVIISPLLTRNGNENIWRGSGNNGSSPDIAKSYNKFCPAVSNTSQICDHAVVGCVAIAMSQVMWYWKWPHAAIVSNDIGNELLRLYNWDLMPYRLVNSSTIAEADMTANLLHDVGVSVNMNYGCSNSLANPSLISYALRNKFGYNADNMKYRHNYTNSEWLNMLKNELNSLRPVIYGGYTATSGHCFVIDGYDSNNMFHINNGDGNLSTSYYTLDAIQYNINQDMFTNVYPNYPSCSPITIPSSDSWATNFYIQNGGGINVGNRTITSSMHGCILSGEYVKLTSGFKVNAGATVFIDIKDMHCGSTREEIANSFVDQEPNFAPQRNNLPNNMPITRKILRDGQLYIEREGKVYTITGQEVK